MDGVHDMGGMDGFGKVEPEPNEPVFHHRWEGRVLAMSRAIGVFRAWTIDTSRYAIELMAPSIYLTRSYYEKWFLRNQNLLIERGLIDADEVAAGRALRPAKNLTRGPFSLADVEKVTKARLVWTAGASAGAVQNRRPRAHEKHSPNDAYALAALRARTCRRGRAAAWRAHLSRLRCAGKGEDPQWLYTVRFDAQELWGADADPKLKVSIEAFEPYLEHV